MALSTTSLCNMALARFGANRINDYGDSSENSMEALYCRLFHDQTIKSLMRSHLWGFAKHRVQLSQNTETPDFQWSYSYALPNDYLRAISIYDGSSLLRGSTTVSWELEGRNLLIDESTVYLRYIRYVSDVTQWDNLFVELGILEMARKLVVPLSQDLKFKEDIDNDWGMLMRRVRALDRQEMEHLGRAELETWIDARYSNIA